MAVRKVKSPAKLFTSNQETLKQVIKKTATRVDGIVGSSLGPGGRVCIIESDLPGIPNVSTKDGVTIFRSLGAEDPFEHLIIEQWRDVAIRTVNEAGDGPQPLHSKVLTPTGFKKMGDIKIGDAVCGLYGTIQMVTGVFPKGKRELCKVTFSDGKQVECCPDHLWTVFDEDGKKQTLPLKDINKDYKVKKYSVLRTVIEYPEKELNLQCSPYELGLMIENNNYEGDSVPEELLFSPIKIRKAVLNGLLDSSGQGNEFKTPKRLINDIDTLLLSLGYSYTKEEVDNDIYNIKLDKGGFNTIVNIENTGELVEMQCIKVSNRDHLYITDGFIPTHNTTTATVLSAALINGLFDFCEKYPKYSPQKGARTLQKLLDTELLPLIDKKSIKINNKNKRLLKKVAQVSANGDEEMADAVIEAFDTVGYGSSSHVTIQQLSGPTGFKVELVEGFPIPKGYEESIGKFHPAFINDHAKQRCVLEHPLFILFDGKINDLVQFGNTLNRIGDEYTNGNADFSNVVVVAHGFSEKVLTSLAFNFQNPETINVLPLKTPIDALINSELNFLMDLSAFTGAKIFDMSNPIADATAEDFGSGMEKIEVYRFRTTITGEPDPINIETRAAELETRIKDAESKLEKTLLEEKLGKLTNGIAKLKIFGSSDGDLKEMADRAEDAVCAVRAAIKHGCLPGGCRTLIDLTMHLQLKEFDNEFDRKLVDEVVGPSLLMPFYKLLGNAGYNEDEIEEMIRKLVKDDKLVFNVETGEVGDFKKLEIFDATLAVKQALTNAVSISKILGTMGGIVAYPRDHQLERNKAIEDLDFQDSINKARSPID